jgi:hypothetical protein
MPLNRDQILGFRPSTSVVEVPDLGTVLIRPLSVGSLNRFLGAREGMDGVRSMLLLCALSICDPSGQCLFTEDDVDQLMSLTPGAVKVIADAVMGLNGLGKGADEAAVKNSSPGPSGDTSSN